MDNCPVTRMASFIWFTLIEHNHICTIRVVTAEVVTAVVVTAVVAAILCDYCSCSNCMITLRCGCGLFECVCLCVCVVSYLQSKHLFNGRDDTDYEVLIMVTIGVWYDSRTSHERLTNGSRARFVRSRSVRVQWSVVWRTVHTRRVKERGVERSRVK